MKITPTTMGSFCKELVLQLEPLPALLESWETSEAEYLELRKNPAFQQELRAAVEEVKGMGPDAGFITRCKILAEDSLTAMVGLMNHATTPPEVKVKLFDQFTELARLKPTKQTANDQRTAGPSVVFNFGALPGMPATLEVSGERIEDANANS